MKPGPKPKPTATKELAGNPGQRRLPPDEPRPDVKAPECPACLSDEAKAIWRRLTPQLVALGIIATIDEAALAAFCEIYARWQEAETSLRSNGGLLVKQNGQIIPNPYLSVANKAAEMVLKIAGEFGLTPSARTRVRATPPTPADGKKSKGSKWATILKLPEPKK